MSPLLLLLACGTASIRLMNDDSGGIGSTDADPDSDADTDAHSDPDTDTDSGGEPNADAGVYTGRIQATVTFMGTGGPAGVVRIVAEEQMISCGGECSFTIDESGSLSGEASCGANDPDGPLLLEGPLSGAAGSGQISTTWTIPMGSESAVVTVSGPVSSGSATLSGEAEVQAGGGTGTLRVGFTTWRVDS